MKIDTNELINKITKDTNLDEFFSQYDEEFRDMTVKDVLDHFLYEKNMKVATVAAASGCGEYTYKIFNGQRNPSRNMIVSIAIGMGLELENCQLLLRIAKFAVLDPRDKKDSVLIFAIKSHYSVDRVNDLLLELGFEEL